MECLWLFVIPCSMPLRVCSNGNGNTLGKLLGHTLSTSMDPHNTFYRDALYLLAPFWPCTWWHGGTTIRSSRTQELHLELLMESFKRRCSVRSLM